MPHSCASRRISPEVLPGASTGYTPERLSFLVFGGNIPHRILKTSLAKEVGADSADGTAGEDTSETTGDEGPDGLERGFEHAAPIDV